MSGLDLGPQGTMILKPETAVEREKQEYNELQAERRRIALTILPAFFASSTDSREGDVEAALDYADLLIKATEFKK